MCRYFHCSIIPNACSQQSYDTPQWLTRINVTSTKCLMKQNSFVSVILIPKLTTYIFIAPQDRKKKGTKKGGRRSRSRSRTGCQSDSELIASETSRVSFDTSVSESRDQSRIGRPIYISFLRTCIKPRKLVSQRIMCGFVMTEKEMWRKR